MAGRQSYTEKTKMNIRYDQKLKRNVFEIKGKKETNGDEVVLSEETVANILRKINLDIYIDVEGYQVSHGYNKSKLEVLCKPGPDLEQFCTHECLELEKGVKTSYIRPAGRKYVEVKVTGLGLDLIRQTHWFKIIL